MLTEKLPELSEWPLATREECWAAFRPAQPFSESAFRRLRRKGFVSPGVSVRHRRKQGRLAGQGRYFSRLNLLALNAHRVGDDTEARRLVDVAESLEERPEFRRLLDFLITSHESAALTQWLIPEKPAARDLLKSLCTVTDSLGVEARHAPTRLPAVVHQIIADGMVDLIIKAGQRFLYSQAKLSRIARGHRGDALMIYLVDIGGSDELIRARPAVNVEEDDVLAVSASQEPGAFDRVTTNVKGAQAKLLDELLAASHPERPVDLTGLRMEP